MPTVPVFMQENIELNKALITGDGMSEVLVICLGQKS